MRWGPARSRPPAGAPQPRRVEVPKATVVLGPRVWEAGAELGAKSEPSLLLSLSAQPRPQPCPGHRGPRWPSGTPLPGPATSRTADNSPGSPSFTCKPTTALTLPGRESPLPISQGPEPLQPTRSLPALPTPSAPPASRLPAPPRPCVSSLARLLLLGAVSVTNFSQRDSHFHVCASYQS